MGDSGAPFISRITGKICWKRPPRFVSVGDGAEVERGKEEELLGER